MNTHVQSDTVAAQDDRLAALCAALVGNYELAESLLGRQASSGYTAADLDVLARIAIHRGDAARAGALWRAAIVADPTLEPSRRALRALDGTWRAKATVQRLVALVAWALLGAAGVVGVSAIAFHLLAASEPGAVATGPQVLSRADPSRGRKDAAAAPITSVHGAKVSFDGRSTRIAFREPLFAYRTEFRSGSQDALQDLGLKVSSLPKSWEVLVEGHTDALLPSVDSPFRDNYTLGLARAAAVARFLVTEAGVSSSVLKVSASGASRDPSSPDTVRVSPADRTVEIVISPRR